MSQWWIKYLLILSTFEILPLEWYHCIQYAKRHHMSLASFCWHQFQQRWTIWTCYLSLSWPALPPGQTSSIINGLLTYVKFSKKHASKVILDSYDGGWYTEHNSTTFVKTSQKLMDWGEFFVHHGKIDKAWHPAFLFVDVDATLNFLTLFNS